MRKKEASAFAKESSDTKANVAALGKAVAAIEKGMAGSFLQSTTAVTIRRLTVDVEMSNRDREVLSSFLSQGEGYAPQSGQISGILQQMKETMEKGLAELTSTEEQAIRDFEALAAAKTKEMKANTKAIESKLERVGQVGVQIEAIKADLDDTSKALLEDKKYLADLETGCKTKQAEWEERSKTRAEELVALADTINILNDDDALELFKRTLPSPAFLQTKVTNAEVKRRTLMVIRSARAKYGHKDARLNLIALALRGKTGSFDKVVKMIDDMVALLGKEQKADEEKKAFCEAELDKSEDEHKALSQQAVDLETAIEEAKGSIAALAEDIAGLMDGIKALDKQVAEATELRKKEHDEYTDLLAANGAAKKLIEVAISRLAKFYTPKTYKAPPKRELTAEDRILVNMGGSAPPTPAPGGIAGTGVVYTQDVPVFAQVSAHVATRLAGEQGAAPPPPPETWDAYQTKGQEHGGVIALLNMLKADLDKEIQEGTVSEKDAQVEYETFTADSAAKRAADSKSVTQKEGTKADLEADVQKMSMEKKATLAEGMAKAKYIHELHLECDWLTANFEVRKEARAGEIESLKQAKAVLAGADFSLVQMSVSAGHQHLRGQA